MGLKTYKPKTAALRFTTLSDFEGVSKKRPESRLIRIKKSQAGRNSQGRITVRHRGGGHKKFLRVVDFKRHDKLDIPATVQAIEFQREPERAPQPNWLVEALAFASVVLPAGCESAKLGEVLAATLPELESHPFTQANKLSAERIAGVVEIARNGLSAVNQHLYG